MGQIVGRILRAQGVPFTALEHSVEQVELSLVAEPPAGGHSMDEPRTVLLLALADDELVIGETLMVLRCAVDRSRWLDARRLEMEGWAFIRYLDLATRSPRIDVVAVGTGGERVPLAVETFLSDRVDEVSTHSFCDYRRGGFRAVLDTSSLDTGVSRWTFEISVSVGRRRRTGRLDGVWKGGSASVPRPGPVADGSAYVSREDADAVDVVVSSPLRRCRETAEVLANDLGVEVVVEPGLVEASFGAWDGLTFAQVQERDPATLDAWLGSTAVAPPGGESYDDVFARVQRLQRRLVASYGGKHVVLVSHVTPIKMFVRLALDAPMPVIHRLELQPAAVSTVRVWPDGISTLHAYDVVPI